jgi:hypothetical protein
MSISFPTTAVTLGRQLHNHLGLVTEIQNTRLRTIQAASQAVRHAESLMLHLTRVCNDDAALAALRGECQAMRDAAQLAHRHVQQLSRLQRKLRP